MPQLVLTISAKLLRKADLDGLSDKILARLLAFQFKQCKSFSALLGEDMENGSIRIVRSQLNKFALLQLQFLIMERSLL